MAFQVLERFETGQGHFVLGLAGQEHREELLFILRQTAERMVEEGLNQWTPSLFTPSLLDEYLAEREVFLLRSGDEPAGMFTLQDSDPSYWKERNDIRFAYLHRLAVLPAYRGFDLGTRMIRFGEKRAMRQGKLGLRLDCVSHLDGLNQYYRRQGYRFVAKQDMGIREVHLYEKTFR
ncbi:GNAT family N-acetyltransferase [Paenibacillus faecalis]|uniref:GNAT family N-acetyltransferase n=1 Tax=Paenibacillus faecalis TaxID=2079532 RepID=UPI000D1099FA|nr:GNAT family N-acetyltransferase [Paenibacillus faecalis]